MGCCRRGGAAIDGQGDSGEKTVKNGLVPRSQRKCRDVFCCLLFLVYWVGMVVVAILAVQTGKPLSLIYGKDYNGDVCGDAGNLTDLKLTAYPRLDEDLLEATAAKLEVASVKFFGVCVSACPLAGARVCTYDKSSCWVQAQDTAAMLFRCIPVASQNETVLSEECIDPVGADPACTNARFLKRECAGVCHTKRIQKAVWEVEATTANPLVEQLQGGLQVLGRFLNDMNAAKWLVLLVGGGGAMLLGVCWLLVLQFFAGCMVWLTCVLVLLGLVLMSLFCSFRSGIIGAEDLSGLSFLAAAGVNATEAATLTAATADSSTQLQFKAAAYVVWTLSGVVLLLLVAMRKRIHIAIAIIRESSKAIKTLPLLLVWPVVPTLFFVLLVVYSVAIAAYLLSSDDLTLVVADSAASLAQITNLTTYTNSSAVPLVQSSSAKTTQQVLLGFHLFGFLWTNQLLHAISICAIAGSVAQFYWTAPGERGGRRLEARFPIARAVRNTLRFSLGSLCFGSFVIAFVQFLRFVLEYVSHNTKQLQQNNRVVKVAFLAIRCCLWCFEKCLKFLSKNAYIVIAMQGSSFCAASVEAFRILVKNVARVAVVNSISFFLLFLVKVTITLAVGAIVFAALSSQATAAGGSVTQHLAILSGSVTSPMAPVLASCILAWLVASAFANVYDTAIDTILLCFCEDTDKNGEAASAFMSKELRAIMGGGSAAKHTVIQVGAPASPVAKEPGAGASSNKVHVDTEI
ncbi:hypothetical protein PybrP1_004488 [[Pythium] brassicae (nom. inval.)]|nr:hypothetical protein PybrP1_004488 [[Pythium] brassicae (nom. inval.)]